MQYRPIALIGPMGSGKSRVAARLAQRLERPCVDLDAEVERCAGATIAAIFTSSGEKRFRQLESEALDAALRDDRAVIATGGGVVLAPANRDLLRTHALVVWLQADRATRLERMRDERAQRPLLADGDPATRLAELDAIRTPLYHALAEFTVDTTTLPVDDVVDQVLALLDRREAAA